MTPRRPPVLTVARPMHLDLNRSPAGVGLTPQSMRLPGGDLLQQLLDPTVYTVFEREYRSLPDDGMYSPSLGPGRPSFEFTLGSFTVPKGQSLWLSDYQGGVLLLDGVNPGDFRPAEEGRFSGSMGFDLTVNERRVADISYQLDPVPIPPNRSQFDPQPGTARPRPAQFNAAAAESFASTSTASMALMPVRRPVQGPQMNKPWMWIIDEGQRVALKCVIFRPILSPIAAIFGRLAGHKIQTNVSGALIEQMRPR